MMERDFEKRPNCSQILSMFDNWSIFWKESQLFGLADKSMLNSNKFFHRFFTDRLNSLEEPNKLLAITNE